MHAAVFNSLIGILDGPVDLDSSRVRIIFRISSSLVRAIIKSKGILFLRYVAGFLKDIGILLPVFGPTFTKKLLNALAICFGSVTFVPFQLI